mgnify:CR=1 FL=1
MLRFPPLSIKQIALTLVIGLLVTAGLIGGFAAWQTRGVTQNLERNNREAARAELAAGLERLYRRAAAQAESLALWDETRQQLAMPEYYAYWRDQRVYESGMLRGGNGAPGSLNLLGLASFDLTVVPDF